MSDRRNNSRPSKRENRNPSIHLSHALLPGGKATCIFRIRRAFFVYYKWSIDYSFETCKSTVAGVVIIIYYVCIRNAPFARRPEPRMFAQFVHVEKWRIINSPRAYSALVCGLWVSYLRETINIRSDNCVCSIKTSRICAAVKRDPSIECQM